MSEGNKNEAVIPKITIIALRHANSGCGRFRGLQSRDWNKKISDQVCLSRRNQRRYNEWAAMAVPHSLLRDALDDVTILSLRRSHILRVAMRSRNPLYSTPLCLEKCGILGKCRTLENF